METRTINDVINSIVHTCQHYRGGGIFDSEHVKKWIQQFPVRKRSIILNEIDNILKNSYASKEDVKQFLLEVLETKEIFKNSIRDSYNKVKFLNIQRKGKSQKVLLNLLDDILMSEYNLDINKCGNTPEKYIYLDDCFYTGNTALWDLLDWGEVIKPYNSEIHLVFVGLYSRDFKYVRDQLIEFFANYNTSIHFWSLKSFYNERIFNGTRNGKFECMWAPNISYTPTSIAYIDEIVSKRSENANNSFPVLRAGNLPLQETLFTSASSREAVEEEFFEKGVQLKSFGVNRNEKMQPFGYDKNFTLGFGSLFVTYRNIANNCPLVLWWGDVNAHAGINSWYPLFPREVND